MTRIVRSLVVILVLAAAPHAQNRATALPSSIELTDGWLMQDVALVRVPGGPLSMAPFVPPIYVPSAYVPPPTAKANPPNNPGANSEHRPQKSSAWEQAPGLSSPSWYRETVPGTVLTTLVNNNIYPDPLYGENNRPNIIPESLSRTSYWYRTEVTVPAEYASRRVWLNFDGINYMADVWVNGKQVGEIRGAFARGIFDITTLVTPGSVAIIAVLIKPPLTPGDPVEQTQQFGRSDWTPAIRDRNIGIWQKVTLSATGPVVIRDPRVVTDVPLARPRRRSAEVSIQVPVRNASVRSQTGTIHGRLGDVQFSAGPMTLEAGESRVLRFSPATVPALRIMNPKLWWPNGYGEPNLYPLELTFEVDGAVSDVKTLNVGIRTIGYRMGESDNLTLVVNGVPVFAKGGNWGLDEALKRIPRERLEAQMRLHREANYTIIRNWVGQSTSEDFYDLADRHGLMVWDEFFQPAAGLDAPLYLANVREKVLRFRNHPSIVLWCGRNEGDPSPKALTNGVAAIMQELDPGRSYQPNSDAGRGVRSGGPYSWQPPAAYYREGSDRTALVPFKTEIGPISIPTVESIYAMMPAEDAQRFPNDTWAEHDFATGGGNNDAGKYIETLRARYGSVDTLSKFVRAAQLANYEALRALYEGRFTRLFTPTRGVLTWMSNPAQPSFTWQIYSHDLEPFGSFFGAKKACEPVHIQMNQHNFQVMAINHLPQALNDLRYRVRVVNLDGKIVLNRRTNIGKLIESAASDLGAIAFPSVVSPVHFVKLELFDHNGQLVSDNFYWRNGLAENDLKALNNLPLIGLQVSFKQRNTKNKEIVVLDVTLQNPGKVVALMAHLQLRNERTKARVLPVYYSDNYVSLLPGERRVITIEVAAGDLGDDQPAIALDGWNIATAVVR